MQIKIKKLDNHILINYEDNNYDFNYDNIEKLIDYMVEHLNETFNVEADEGLENYKKLINDLIVEVKTQDFIDAYNKAVNGKRTLETNEL